jgi:hypothetical protein
MSDTLRLTIVAVIKTAMKAYLNNGPLIKTEGAFDRQLWSAALDLFRGDIDEFAFIDIYTSAIDNQLTRAWNEGARSVGTDPRDFEDADIAYLQGIIDRENEFVLGLGGDIVDYKTEERTLDEFRVAFRSRVMIWANRYNDVKNQAAVYFSSKGQRLEWVYGDTQHCTTCAMLNGIVAFASEWETSGLKPQSPPNDAIECGGWHCQCKLEPTNKRRTPGALDRLLTIATMGKV